MAGGTDDGTAEPLLVDRIGTTMLLTLNRPHVHNAVDRAMATRFGAALAEAQEDDGVHVVVLHGGNPGSFCSGADLKGVAAGVTPNAEGHEEWGFLGLVKHFVDKPIVASVAGSAYAGGVEMLLACDLVVAAEDARFVLTEVEHGLFPSMGGTVRMGTHVPLKVAFEWLFLGEAVGMAEALQHGLVNRVVPADDVLPTALALAERLASMPPPAVRACKRAFYGARNGTRLPEATHWLVNDAEWVALRASPAGQEGPRAYAEGRRTRWSTAR